MSKIRTHYSLTLFSQTLKSVSESSKTSNLKIAAKERVSPSQQQLDIFAHGYLPSPRSVDVEPMHPPPLFGKRILVLTSYFKRVDRDTNLANQKLKESVLLNTYTT